MRVSCKMIGGFSSHLPCCFGMFDGKLVVRRFRYQVGAVQSERLPQRSVVQLKAPVSRPDVNARIVFLTAACARCRAGRLQILFLTCPVSRKKLSQLQYCFQDVQSQRKVRNMVCLRQRVTFAERLWCSLVLFFRCFPLFAPPIAALSSWFCQIFENSFGNNTTNDIMQYIGADAESDVPEVAPFTGFNERNVYK